MVAADLQQLRSSVDILAADYTVQNSKIYTNTWKSLFVFLKSNEPFNRSFALNCCLKLSKSLNRTLVTIMDRKTFIFALVEIMIGDELPLNRSNAVFLLGETVLLMMDLSFPDMMRKSVFNSIMSSFLLIFPPDLSLTLNADPDFFAKTVFVGPFTEKLRISFLLGIGKFMRCPEMYSDDILNYIDVLFPTLLKSQTSILLQICVIKTLHLDWPMTNRNRIRVDMYYQAPISALSAELIKEGIDGRPKETRPFLNLSVETGLKRLLSRTISNFVAKWYPRLADIALLRLNSSVEHMTRLGHGYSQRRRNWLLEDPKKAIIDLNNIDIKMKINSLKKGTRAPYILIKEAKLNRDTYLYCFTERKEVSKSIFGEILKNENKDLLPITDDMIAILKVNYEVPDITPLAFNSPMGISIVQSPSTREIYLQNKSLLSDIRFSLQVGFRPDLFQVYPATGVISKGETIPIKLDHRASVHEYSRSSELLSYIKVRSSEGFCGERVSLKAQSFPSIKIFPNVVDFPPCFSSETRIILLTLVNLQNSDAKVAFHFSSVSNSKLIKSSVFHLSSSQIELGPKEKKIITVKFQPISLGNFEDNLVVVYGGDFQIVKLTGVCQSSFKLMDHEIDFGPVDFLYQGMKRRFLVKNNDKKRQLPISFISTSNKNEIRLEGMSNIVLEPGESKRLELEFSSNIAGFRKESISFFAPNSKVEKLEITGFSGPKVLTPLMEDIFFAPTMVNSTSVIHFPVSNTSLVQIQVHIILPCDSKFTMKCLDDEISNNRRNSTVGAALLVESSHYESSTHNGLTIRMSPRATAVIEVEISTSIPGVLRDKLSTQLVNSRKPSIISQENTHYLNAVIIDSEFIMDEKNLEATRLFLDNPGKNLFFSPQKVSTQSNSSKENTVFEIDPPIQSIFVTKDLKDVAFDSILLSNMSNTPQAYHILISYPFYTDVSLDGIVDKQGTLEIPIHCDYSNFFDEFKREILQYSFFGGISVYNEENYEIASSKLVGIYQDMIQMVIRPNIDQFSFGHYKMQDKGSREFFLRNKSPFEIMWEGRIVAYGKGAGLQADGVPLIVPSSYGNEWCAFSLSTGRIVMKPFEVVPFVVHFQAHVPGFYMGCLFMEYKEQNKRPGSRDNSKPGTVIKHKMNQISFNGTIGTVEVAGSPDCLVFGDVQIGEKSTKILSITNPGNISTPVSLSLTCRDFGIPSSTIIVPPNGRVDLPVTFTPRKDCAYSETILLTCHGVTKNVPFIANGYERKSLLLNAGALTIKKSKEVDDSGIISNTDLENSLDFGFIDVNQSKKKLLKITNKRSCDLVIKAIGSDDDNATHLHWKFLEDADILPADIQQCKLRHALLSNGAISAGPNTHITSFSEMRLDETEFDFDEFDNNIKDISGGGGAKFNARHVTRGSQIRKKKYRASISSASPSSDLTIFPFSIPPFQSLNLVLSYGSPEKGLMTGKLNIELDKSNDTSEIFQLAVIGNCQPALQLCDKKINFGIKALHESHKGDFRFSNEGTMPMNWTLVHESTKVLPVAKFSTGKPKNLKFIRSPITVYPISGRLLPGCTQTVDIKFTPNIAQHEVFCQYNLKTEDFSDSPLLITGIGASSKLICDIDKLEFGVLRLGTSKKIKFKLKNEGILQTRYFVECTNTQYSADPEQGVLDGNGNVEITVNYFPKVCSAHIGVIKIAGIYGKEYTMDPVIVDISGIGSYPELVVLTRSVDFGTALFGTRNIRPVKLENKGAAEAHVMFNCHKSGIFMDKGTAVIIPPHTIQEIDLVYIPDAVEYLNIKVFFRSSDSRGDYFMVHLTGMVGVPKLTTIPTDIFDNLDFGVCPTHLMHEKSFTMINEGNIPLKFNGELIISSIKPIVRAGYTTSLVKIIEDNAVSIEPLSGELPVGESIIVKIIFNPRSISEYLYQLTINYDFKKIVTVIKGTGGQAILKVDNQLQYLDFGVCRMGRVFKKVVTLSNSGNLPVKYIIRPQPPNGDWSVYDNEIWPLKKYRAAGEHNEVVVAQDENAIIEEPFWLKYLKTIGFILPNANSYCSAYGRSDLLIEFCPSTEASVSINLRIFLEGGFTEDVEVRGCAAVPRLAVYSTQNLKIDDIANNKVLPVAGTGAPVSSIVPQIEFGVRTVSSESEFFLQLSNEGPFGCDFLIQPHTAKEFDIYPKRGFVESGTIAPLKIYFRPNSENKYQMPLKILWEGEPIRINLIGSGGKGNMDVIYWDEKDAQKQQIDFGDVPFNTSREKTIFLYNSGKVPVRVSVNVDTEQYSIATVGEPDVWKGIAEKRSLPRKSTIHSWGSSSRCVLPPSMAVEIAARFFTNSPTTCPGTISVQSECGEILIRLRGKGGSVKIAHKGDLSFGDVASSFTYSRNLTLTNTGTISLPVNLYWSIVGQTMESDQSSVKLTQTYSPIDPRSGWARTQMIKDRGFEPLDVLTGKDYWRVLQRMVCRQSIDKFFINSDISSTKIGTLWDILLTRLKPMFVATPTPNGRMDHQQSSEEITDMHLYSNQSSSVNVINKKKPIHPGSSHSSTFFKRRQMFYSLITNSPVSAQSSVIIKPFISVEPGTVIIPRNGEVKIEVQINLAIEETFLATLMVKPVIPNVPTYEISMTVTPKAVSIVCNDTSKLNFNRQPIGEPEVTTRTFTNIGRKNISFAITNPNSFLSINPDQGVLPVGQTVCISFTFKAQNESEQNGDVVFEPDCSQPIKFKMYGSGGNVKCSLSRYRKFDFGQCMIGKETVSFLPIVNEGNAILHLTRFEFIESETFYKGAHWPNKKISLQNNESFNLPIVFNPKEETPKTGKLLIGTLTDMWDIELTGLGREAVLIVSKLALEFTECLIGNAYEQKLGLKNVGDVNYPLSLYLEKEFKNVTFTPNSMVLAPFSDGSITISYSPKKQQKTNIVLVISSPYSTHKIPILLHSGTATLEFSVETIDFGMFERMSKPSLNFKIKNTGTVFTSYSVKDVIKPSKFLISNNKGSLPPGKQIELELTYVRHEICEFFETLAIRTDLINKVYQVNVVGQCQEASVHSNEISFINMGICPILEPTVRKLDIKNYGKFPLTFTIKSAYPLKVSPISGEIKGDETKPLMVSWTPSGSYELRTQITMLSNIGNINITVRGKSSFPELAVKMNSIDFGVCALGHNYNERATLMNKGKVPLYFTISTPRESCYSITRANGSLQPKEELDFNVGFNPSAFGRFASSLIVECKGINYKEILLSGIGAIMKLEISPQAIDLGRCSYDLQTSHVLVLNNQGDVTINASFSQSESSMESGCSILLPDGVEVKPRQTVRCPYAVTVSKVGTFQCSLELTTKEEIYVIPMFGVGIKISLSNKSRSILANELLRILNVPDPIKGWIFEDHHQIIKSKFRLTLAQDLKIVDKLSQLISHLRKTQAPRDTSVILPDFQHHMPSQLKVIKTDNQIPASNSGSMYDLTRNLSRIMNEFYETQKATEMIQGGSLESAVLGVIEVEKVVKSDENVVVIPITQHVVERIVSSIDDGLVVNANVGSVQNDQIQQELSIFTETKDLLAPQPISATTSWDVVEPSPVLSDSSWNVVQTNETDSNVVSPNQTSNISSTSEQVEGVTSHTAQSLKNDEKIDEKNSKEINPKPEESSNVFIENTPNANSNESDSLDPDEVTLNEDMTAQSVVEESLRPDSLEESILESIGESKSKIDLNLPIASSGESVVTDSNKTADSTEEENKDAVDEQITDNLDVDLKNIRDKKVHFAGATEEQNQISNETEVGLAKTEDVLTIDSTNLSSNNERTVSTSILQTISLSGHDESKEITSLPQPFLVENTSILEDVPIENLVAEPKVQIAEVVPQPPIDEKLVVEQPDPTTILQPPLISRTSVMADAFIPEPQPMVGEPDVQILETPIENTAVTLDPVKITHGIPSFSIRPETPVATKIYVEEPKYTREYLLKKIPDGIKDGPSADSLDFIEEEYLEEIKRKEYEVINFTEEEGVHFVIHRPYPKIEDQYTPEVLYVIEPDLKVKLEIITHRPPPFSAEFQPKTPLLALSNDNGKHHYNRYGKFPGLKRKERNALTIAPFRDVYGTFQNMGVGVQIYRGAETENLSTSR